jgi:hypothetical protein
MIKFQDVKRPAYDIVRKPMTLLPRSHPGQAKLRLEDEVSLEKKHQDLADGLQALQGRSHLDSF